METYKVGSGEPFVPSIKAGEILVYDAKYCPIGRSYEEKMGHIIIATRDSYIHASYAEVVWFKNLTTGALEDLNYASYFKRPDKNFGKINVSELPTAGMKLKDVLERYVKLKELQLI